MRLSVFCDRTEETNLRWASLPALCCQAAGGKPEHTEPIAAAWFSFYMAAGIMDSVEDGDPPADWWGDAGPGLALSVATGLYFTGNLALHNLEDEIGGTRAARRIRKEILSEFLVMGAGQHLDIIQPSPNMEQYWQIAKAKSGAFFALACWAGARVATRQRRKLLGYQQFGMNVGLLIQVLDDLHDYLQLSQPQSDRSGIDLKRSLLAVYVREVAPQLEKNQFESLLNSKMSPDDTKQIFEMIEKYWGARYLSAELDRLYQSAIQGLDQADADQPARDQLMSLLNELHTN